jgi:hypothetical protein
LVSSRFSSKTKAAIWDRGFGSNLLSAYFIPDSLH